MGLRADLLLGGVWWQGAVAVGMAWQGPAPPFLYAQSVRRPFLEPAKDRLKCGQWSTSPLKL